MGGSPEEITESALIGAAGGVVFGKLPLRTTAGPSVAAATKTIEEGIYIIRGVRGTYVGQSGNISGRFENHLLANGGRFSRSELDAAERIEVLGGKTAREIAEQLKIDELGMGNLINKRNPIGPNRFHLMPEGYSRPK